MWLLPEHKVGGLIIVNDDAFDYMPLFESFMDHYYPKKDEQRAGIALTKDQLSRFDGTFRDLRIPLWTTQVSAGEGFLNIQEPVRYTAEAGKAE